MRFGIVSLLLFISQSTWAQTSTCSIPRAVCTYSQTGFRVTDWNWQSIPFPTSNPPVSGAVASVGLVGSENIPRGTLRIHTDQGAGDTDHGVWAAAHAKYAIYQPRTLGPISRITARQSAYVGIEYPETPPQGIYVLVRQSGRDYVAHLGDFVFKRIQSGKYPPEQHTQAKVLTQGDFARIGTDGTLDFSGNPDFSATGDAIWFGFAHMSKLPPKVSSSDLTNARGNRGRLTGLSGWYVAIEPGEPAARPNPPSTPEVR